MTSARDTEESPTEEPWERRWPPVTYWAKVAVVIAVVVAALYQVRFVADIVLLVLIAFVLAAGLDPIVERLQRRGFSRGRAVGIVFASGAVVLAAVIALVAPAVAGQLTGLSDDIPRYVARAEEQDGWLGDYLARTDAAEQVRTFIKDLPNRIGSSFGTVLGLAGQVGAAIFAVLTVVILTGYLLASLPRLRRTATIVVPPEHRDRAEAAIDRSVARIGAYVAGNAVTSVVCAVTTVAGLMLLRVPFAVPLGIWAGFADLIPIVGPYVGAAPAVIVAFFVSPTLGVFTALFFFAYQQVENYVLVPRVMRNAVHLSPAAVILSTLIGAKLAGFAGALLALPLAATLKVVIVESWLRDRVSEGDPLAREQLGRVRREERAAARTRGTSRRSRLLGWVGDRVRA